MPKKNPPSGAKARPSRIAKLPSAQAPTDLAAMTGAQVGNPPIITENTKKKPPVGGLKDGKAEAKAVKKKQ